MTRLRRPALLLLVPAAAGLLAVPGQAAPPLPSGTVNVVAGPQASATSFLTTQLVATTGTQVSFLNLDTTTHDVTSRLTKTVKVGKKTRKVPLFHSAITPSGGNSKVAGSEKLKAGNYDFFCSLHPGMRGVLTVR